MAEVVGAVASAITLAGLFKACVEAFDVIHSYQSQALDLKKLTLKLNIEKCRLYTWGQAMGLTTVAKPNEKRPVDLISYPELIQEALGLILDIFQDSEKLSGRYGCTRTLTIDPARSITQEFRAGVLQQLNATFDHFKIKSTTTRSETSLAKKASWVIQDRKRFEILVYDAKSLIDGLQDITKDLQSHEAQEEVIASRIRKINDLRALDWLSEVCSDDYPAFSDAASHKAETISEISRFYQYNSKGQSVAGPIEHDDEEGSDASSVESAIASLEDMTVTELKHKLSTYLLRAKEGRLRERAIQGGINPTEVANADDEPFFLSNQPEIQSNPEQFSSGPVLEHLELETSESLLRRMAEAAGDRDFQDELSAILQWLRVLSPAEQDVVFYRVGEHISKDLHRTRLFSRIQSHRLSMLLSSGEEAKPPDGHLKAVSISTSLANTDHSKPEQTALPLRTGQFQENLQRKKTWVPPSNRPEFLEQLRDSFNAFAGEQKRTFEAAFAVQRQAQRALEMEDLRRSS
ncbi:prion-inhibition and propagation-domain-containing protein [Aspergillus granulosus]|uniref:Prion-inhibition and propagation-domain-containing protein n=1 Tax=Aspergillus granulosus TaxID=176169 RepID=A0ABR4GX34_9EURO